MSESSKLPYRSLGVQLKSIRERRRQSIDQVSGALEIDVDTLKRIEQGVQRPSEDILNLLLSYLAVGDNEADKLLNLAGYDDTVEAEAVITDDGLIKQMAILMPMDSRVVYTDTVHVVVNNYGVVINFMQNNGPGNQQLAVARVGMSREHAKSVLEILKSTLEQSGNSSVNKTLPPTNSQTKES